MVPLDEQVELIRATRAAAPDARAERPRRRASSPVRAGVDEAVARGNAYLAAGADCVYPILAPFEAIGCARRRNRRPGATCSPIPPSRSLAELEQLGVAARHVRLEPRVRRARRGRAARGARLA